MSKESLLAPLRARIQKEQEELDRLASVLCYLPELPYKYVHGHAYKGDVTASFEVKGIEEVRPLLEALPPLPLVMVRNGCLSFHPEGGENKGEVTPVYGLLVRADNVTRPSVEFEWFSDLASGKRVSAKARLDNCWDWVRWSGEKRMRHGEVYWANESFAHRFGANPQIVRWSKGSGEYLGNYTLYWPRETALDNVFLRADKEKVVARG